jgi:2'-5' RNA ligase
MPRLFVAIDLPQETVRELVRIQPQPGNGLRLTRPDQMHLTLHFLGEADLSAACNVLQMVAAPPFSLVMEGVGTFGSNRRGLVLWAGIRNVPPLQSLHAALGEALQLIGYQPESRPFAPHITLARCAPDVPRKIIDDFLCRNAGFALPEFPVSEFVLYSSTLSSQGSVYRREKVFPLAG